MLRASRCYYASLGILFFAFSALFIWNSETAASPFYHNEAHHYSLEIPAGWEQSTESISQGSDLTLVNKDMGVVVDIQYLEESEPSAYEEYCRLMEDFFRSDKDFDLLKTRHMDLPRLDTKAFILFLKAKDKSHIRAVAFVPRSLGPENRVHYLVRAMARPSRSKQAEHALEEVLGRLKLEQADTGDGTIKYSESQEPDPEYQVVGTRYFSFLIPKDWKGDVKEGEEQYGIICHFSKGDVEFFLRSKALISYPGTAIEKVLEREIKMLKMIYDEVVLISKNQIKLSSRTALEAEFKYKNSRKNRRETLLTLITRDPHDDSLYYSLKLTISPGQSSNAIDYGRRVFEKIKESFLFESATKRSSGSKLSQKPQLKAERRENEGNKINSQKVYVHEQHGYRLKIPAGWERVEDSPIEAADITLVNKKMKVVAGIQVVEEDSSFSTKEYFERLVSLFRSESSDFEVLGTSRGEFQNLGRDCYIMKIRGKDGSQVRTAAIISASPNEIGCSFYIVLAVSTGHDAENTEKAITEILPNLTFMPYRPLTRSKGIKATPQVFEIKFAKGIENGKPYGISSVFDPDTNPIYVWFRYKNIPKGSKIRCIWHYLGRGKPYKIGEGGVDTVLESDWVQFNYELAAGKKWPPGKYRVDIILGSKTLDSAFFEVKETELSADASHVEKMTPFYIVEKLNQLIVKTMRPSDYLPYLDEESQRLVMESPDLLASFLKRFRNVQVDAPFEITQILADGPDYLVSTRSGYSLRFRRIENDENFRLALWY